MFGKVASQVCESERAKPAGRRKVLSFSFDRARSVTWEMKEEDGGRERQKQTEREREREERLVLASLLRLAIYLWLCSRPSCCWFKVRSLAGNQPQCCEKHPHQLHMQREAKRNRMTSEQTGVADLRAVSHNFCGRPNRSSNLCSMRKVLNVCPVGKGGGGGVGGGGQSKCLTSQLNCTLVNARDAVSNLQQMQ